MELSELTYLSREERRGQKFIHFELNNIESINHLLKQDTYHKNITNQKLKGFLRECEHGYEAYLDDKKGNPLYLEGNEFTKEEVRRWAISSLSQHINEETHS